MTTIQKILFPVDFSPSCAAMAPFVKRAAAMFSAKVTLLYILEPCVSGFELLTRPLPQAEEDRKIVACAKLESYLGSEFPLHEIPRLLVAGEAAVRIAEVARERGFTVIVMPTHAGVFRRTLLGSTTAKVLNDADCMVLTTQHAETISPRRLEHREWVCAIGLSADSERVLRIASQLAETAHANLTLVHAIPSAVPGVPAQLDLEERVQSMEKQAARERVRELQRVVGSHAHASIAVGPIKDALTEAACRLQADVLVIGRSSQPGAQGRLRDLTYAVVRDAPCPVLSV
ncbi:MAG: universal stress protein [Terriglobia bacterium]|jgi:nucleotide-binding universal stress UspA family protein